MMSITYIIKPSQMACQCQPVRPHDGKGASMHTICKHLKHYLVTYLGIRAVYLPVLEVPRVKDWCTQIDWRHHTGAAGPGDTINAHCYDFFYHPDDGCQICMQAYANLPDLRRCLPGLYQCKKCREFYHKGCYKKWENSGLTGLKGCPRCKHVHGDF